MRPARDIDAPLLSGRYELLAPVGEGASATVYKARDAATDSIVAVKILKPHLLPDRVSFERFGREIQLTRHLAHPHIVAIYDLVRDAGGAYLVMEYLSGSNLKDFIKLHAPVAVETALAILRQVLEVLAVCHAKNVVHRDLKPQNIVVGADTTVKLLDFGVARMAGTSDLTQTGAALGSPEYMAPELFGANTFDPRTDLYALGIIAFELLAGRLPFTGDSLPLLYRQHLTAPVPALRETRRDVPEWVAQLVERLLAKKAFQRYQSADEALADLDARRVIAREVAALATRECVQCGEHTLAELPVCVMCGHAPPATPRLGTCDVRCARDEDDRRLEGWVHEVLGRPGALRRRRRTLLLAGIDPLSAELVKRSAERHGMHLTVRRHSLAHELRKAAWLALASLFAGGLLYTVVQAVGFYGWYYLDQLDGAQSLRIGLLLVLGAVALRRCSQLEVRPLLSASAARARAIGRESAWIERLAPALTADRSAAMKALVAQLMEQQLKLTRAGGEVDATVSEALVQVVDSAARLACVLSEIERGLGAARFVERSQAYATLARAARLEGDAAERGERAHEPQRLEGELQAYQALADQHDAVVNKLIALQAVFNRLVGRALVLRAPIDEDDHGVLAECVRALTADLEVSRQVQRELEELG